jgi:hypothetical protein
MNRRDLTVLADSVKRQAEYRSLRTGRPCGLVPITLRRMILLPPLWIGWKAVVILPMEKAPALAVWQYLRMLRLYVAFFALIVCTLIPRSFFDPAPGTPLAVGLALAGLVSPIVVWIGLGRLLDRREFVRLLRYSNRTGTVTIRFATESLARQAESALVSPDERDQTERPAPQT